MFSSEDAPSAEIQDFIAERFWTFLLSEPSDLVDYEARMFHSGACIWIRYGVESGEPFMMMLTRLTPSLGWCIVATHDEPGP